MTANDVIQALKKVAEPKRVYILQRFFKTGAGEYAEGDKFIGVRVPNVRAVSKQFQSLTFGEIEKLLRSPIHEHRLTALFILILQFKKVEPTIREKIVKIYWRHTKFINNWDLVDLSAPNILGEYYADKERAILYTKARSKNLWERRMAMLACYTFIKREDFLDALKIAQILLYDKHDLINKAVGWMLREVGNRDRKVAEVF